MDERTEHRGRCQHGDDISEPCFFSYFSSVSAVFIILYYIHAISSFYFYDICITVMKHLGLANCLVNNMNNINCMI